MKRISYSDLKNGADAYGDLMYFLECLSVGSVWWCGGVSAYIYASTHMRRK